MRAMVLAAGLGTRLRPLTDDRPKALVEIDGRTLLAITLSRLQQVGINDVVINTHHFADKLIDCLRVNHNFGIHIEISREDILLDTGGGLKKAAHFFLRDQSDEPFLLHNVDVLSNIDLNRMIAFHREHSALATLAVRDRASSRHLLFDQQGNLCGRRISKTGRDPVIETARACQSPVPLAFCGIHVISPQLLVMIREEGIFSIIDVYLRLAAEGHNIAAFRADDYYWRDLGKPDSITQAEQDAARGLIGLA